MRPRVHDRGVMTSLRAGLAGVGAAAAALGVAELVAVATGPTSAPLLAVGGVVVDHVPAGVKDFGIAVFGVHDKTALLTGTAVLLAAYAFGAGVVAARRWWAGVGLVAVFGVVGVVSAVTRHDAGVVAALPSLVAAVVAVVVLRGLLALAAGEPVAALRERAAWGVGTGARSSGAGRSSGVVSGESAAGGGGGGAGGGGGGCRCGVGGRAPVLRLPTTMTRTRKRAGGGFSKVSASWWGFPRWVGWSGGC